MNILYQEDTPHLLDKSMLVNVLPLLLFSLILLITVGYNNVYAQDLVKNDGDLHQVNSKTDLDEKLYRRALFYYFQKDYSKALRQVADNEIRLASLKPKSQLFGAGLQLSVGLQHQAKKTLLSFESNLTNQSSVVKSKKDKLGYSTQQELLLIALLQLAEQSVLQGQLKQAQTTLEKISHISGKYYSQYHSLSQLAYWPNKPLMTAKLIGNEVEHNQTLIQSPFVQMNQALRHIELAEYNIAKPLLITLKNQQWKKTELTFWQSLFEQEQVSGLGDEKNNSEQLQHQAINDYARLLLAQMYVGQENYQQAFYELEAFPEASPYAESALFLFAFSAQQVKQYTIALNLLSLLAKKYTYSSLSWQAGILLAAQVSQQNSLSEGLALYQKIDRFYQQRIIELKQFKTNFDGAKNLLNFSVDKNIGIDVVGKDTEKYTATEQVQHKLHKQNNPLKLSTDTQYFPQSKWLQKALQDIELSQMYHDLIELDLLTQHLHNLKQKNSWLASTITLNQARKVNIAAKQQEIDYQSLIVKFSQKRDVLHQKLLMAKKVEDGQVFANKKQQRWLSGIANSQRSLNYLSTRKGVTDYQQRLKRASGVLAWQLRQSYPERLWEHQKQLIAIDNLLLKVSNQLASFESLAKADSRLNDMIKRQGDAEENLNALLILVKKLRVKTQINIRQRVLNFIASQHSLLQEHLLDTRQATASVLEKMAAEDRRIEQQLVPNLDNERRANFE